MAQNRIEGLNNVLNSLKALGDEERINAALGRACAIVERAAKEKAPKGNGELRRSITSKVEEGQGIIFTPLFYAPYVEYGTGLFAESEGRKDVPWRYQDDEGNWHTTCGMPPSPFLRPALQESQEKIIEVLRESLNNG